MKKITILAVFALAGIAAFSQDKRSVSLSVSADTSVAPDRFKVNVSYGETKDFFGKKNIENLENDILKILKNEGVDIKKDVKTSSQRSYAEKGKEPLISKTMAFTLSAYPQVTGITSRLNLKGIQSVYLVSTDSSEREAIEKSLRKKAVQKARSVAEDFLAETSDKVGGILKISGSVPITAGYGILAKTSNLNYGR